MELTFSLSCFILVAIYFFINGAMYAFYVDSHSSMKRALYMIVILLPFGLPLEIGAAFLKFITNIASMIQLPFWFTFYVFKRKSWRNLPKSVLDYYVKEASRLRIIKKPTIRERIRLLASELVVKSQEVLGGNSNITNLK